MSTEDSMKVREEIIAKALPHVAFEGWTWEAVLQGAKDAGFDDAEARRFFPERVVDVLGAFSEMADRAMLDVLEGQNPAEMRVRDRVRTALLARFDYLRPHKEAMRQSLKFWIAPLRKPRAAKMVWRTADVIWEWAGDESTDYNRYTKRGLLSGIIVSTTIFWLNDNSENMSKTKDFLDRRIENVMQLGKAIGKFRQAS